MSRQSYDYATWQGVDEISWQRFAQLARLLAVPPRINRSPQITRPIGLSMSEQVASYTPQGTGPT